MYRPHTLHSDIGDVEILEHEGKLHLFHLVIPNRDLVAHCVSEDGLVWKELPAAISTSAPVAPDDDMIRTVSVTPCGGKFYMMYSGCSRKDGGRVERICIAVSDDLYSWKKLPEVSGIEACPRIYENNGSDEHFVDWRDPKPYYEDGVYYCVVSSRKRDGAFLRKGCVALMTSKDMLNWEYQEPLFLPGAYYTVECPQIYRIKNRYYLIGSIMEDRSQRYWVSDQLQGPYRVLGGENLLMPPHSHYAGRMTRFQGRDVYLCWTYAIEDGPSPFRLQREANAQIKYIPALLDVKTDDEGRLILKSINAWKRFEKKQLLASAQDLSHTLCGNIYANNAGGIFSSPSGMEMWFTQARYRSFRLDCHLKVEGYCGGIIFHVNDDGSAYEIEFYPYEQLVQLKVHAQTRRSDGNKWFMYRIIQAVHCNLDYSDIQINLLAVGGEIELSLNSRVRFSTVSTAILEGRWGVFANCASVKIEEISLKEMAIPGVDICPEDDI